MTGFKSSNRAARQIAGIETMHMVKKGSYAARVAWHFQMPTTSTASPSVDLKLPDFVRSDRLNATKPNLLLRRALWLRFPIPPSKASGASARIRLCQFDEKIQLPPPADVAAMDRQRDNAPLQLFRVDSL